jgi:AraC-like DNA-binding protein
VLKETTVTKSGIFRGTPAQIIQNIKILEAKRKLAQKQLSIQTVAFDLGFDQPTYFTVFQKNDRTYLNNFKRLFPNLPLSLSALPF